MSIGDHVDEDMSPRSDTCSQDGLLFAAEVGLMVR